MAWIKLTESQKLWHFNIVMVMVLGILFIAKANPVSETFSCDEYKICKIEKKYVLPPLNRTKTFKLNLGACIKPIEKYHSSKTYSYYIYHLGLDNRLGKTEQLFKVSSERQDSGENYSEDFARDVFKNESALFEKYKKNPKRKYRISSKAEPGDFAFWLYTWIIFMTLLMFWNIFIKK